MKLTGKQFNDIQGCLLEVYPTRDELRMIVRFGLDESLDAIAGGDNQRVLIFNLLTWAERSGRLSELVKSAHAQYPRYPAVQKLMEIWNTVTWVDLDGPKLYTGPATVDVFLSSSRKDSKAMRTVQESLRNAGLAAWTDENLVPGTPDWKDAIQAALSQAQALVVLLSPNAMKSEWVNKEIGFALARRVRVFPVLVEGDEQTSVPIDIINVQWVDGRENLPRALTQRLLPALHLHLHPLLDGAKPSDPSPKTLSPVNAKTARRSVAFSLTLIALMVLSFAAIGAWYVRGYTLDNQWSQIGYDASDVLATSTDTSALAPIATPLLSTDTDALAPTAMQLLSTDTGALAFTANPTATDTRTPAPTATPLLPTANPTAATTNTRMPATATPLLPTTSPATAATNTRTPTPSPTATPTRVAAAAPSDSQCRPWSDDLVPTQPVHTAVDLGKPEANAVFTGPEADILLTWQGSRLGDGQQYLVVLRYPNKDGIYFYDYQPTSATSLTVREYIFANMPSSSRDVTWFVVILEGEVCEAGYWGLRGSVVSAKSDTRSFSWELPVTGTTPFETPPTATPASDTPVATPLSS